MYNKPYSTGQIRRNYPQLADKLLKDPIHKWRAETGTELIHKEPTKKELVRIWENWQEMKREQKVASDKKSLELFGLINEEHYQKLIKEY